MTYLYGNEDGIEYTLTLSHLIYGRNVSELNEKYYEVVSTYETLSSRAKYHHRLLSQFAKQWKGEYLLGLLESNKLNANGKKPVVSVGDIVILKDVQNKRSFWKICKIIQLISGTDGNIRAAKIQFVADKSQRVFIRPLKLLIPLEIQQPQRAAESNEVHTVTVANSASAAASERATTLVALNSTPRSDRSKRNAVVITELRRKHIIAFTQLVS